LPSIAVDKANYGGVINYLHFISLEDLLQTLRGADKISDKPIKKKACKDLAIKNQRK